jgi:hypothetical protein
MMGPTHKRIGTGTALIATAALFPTTPWALLLLVLAGRASTLPDKLEHTLPMFMPWRYRARLRAHIIPFQIWTVPLQHRRATHYPETTVPLCVLLTVGAWLVHPLVGLLTAGAMIGVVMHLFADAATLTGIPSLIHTARGNPDRRLRILPRGLRVRTDGSAEPWVNLGVTVLSIGITVGIVLLTRPGAPPVPLWALAAAGGFLLMLTAPVRYAARRARVSQAWNSATRDAGAVDPSPKHSHRKAGDITVRRLRKSAAGDKLTVKIEPGNSIDNLVKHRQAIATALDKPWYKVSDLRITPNPDRASRATALIVTRDPFAKREPPAWPWLDKQETSLWDPIPFGVNEEGEPVTLRLPYRSMLIGGLPDSGKSVALQTIVASAALDPNAVLWLLDGKGNLELGAWNACAHQYAGANPTDALRLMRDLAEQVTLREQDLKQKKVRKITRDMGLPLHLLAIDEIAEYANLPNPKDALEFNRLLGIVARKGRALGFIPVAATQKPHGDNMDTNNRDLFHYRLAFASSNATMSNLILSDGWAGNGYNAADIPTSQPGVGYLRTQGHPVKIRTPYLTDTDLETIASRAAGNRAQHDLDQLTHEVPPPPTPPPKPTVAEQRERSDRAKLIEVLPVSNPGFSRTEVLEALGCTDAEWKRVSRVLNLLIADGAVVRDGKGVRGDGFRWRLCTTVAPDGAQHEDDAVEPN